MNSKTKFCSECGAALIEGSRFCGECGASVEDKKQSSESSTPRKQINKKSKFKFWLLIPVITIFSVASYIGFVLFQTGGDLLPTVTAVSFSSQDNNKLVSVGTDNHLEIWDIDQGKSINRKKIPSGYAVTQALTWDRKNQIIALSRIHGIPIGNEIKLLNPENLKQIASLSTGADATIALCIDPDGNTLYSVTNRLGISVWDIQKGERLGGFKNLPNRLVTSVSFDSNCQKIATIEGTTATKNGFHRTDKKIMVYQRINMETLFMDSVNDPYEGPDYVGLNHSGKKVNTLEQFAEKFQSWDINTRKMKETVLTLSGSSQTLAIGSGDRIAIGGDKGIITILNDNGKYEQTLHHGSGLGLVLAPILDYFD